MMHRDGGRVYIELSEDDFGALLFCLGMAWTAAARVDQARGEAVLRLTNEINANNPNYVPYEVPKPKAE